MLQRGVKRGFDIYVDECDRRGAENLIEDLTPAAIVQDRATLDGDGSGLAQAVEHNDFENSVCARIAFAPCADEDISLPYGARKFPNGPPNSWFLTQTSETPSFAFKLGGSCCEGYYHKDGGSISVQNRDSEPLNVVRLVACKPLEESQTVIAPSCLAKLDVGPWRISFANHNFVDLYIFEQAFDVQRKTVQPRNKIAVELPAAETAQVEFGENSPPSAYIANLCDSQHPSISVQRRRRPLRKRQRLLGDEKESYTVQELSEVTGLMSMLSLRTGRHSRYGLVAIKELHENKGSLINELTMIWRDEVKNLRLVLNQRNKQPHPSIAELRFADARSLSIFTDYSFPILLFRTDEENHFSGPSQVLDGILRDIPSGLSFLHNVMGWAHFNISSLTIVYNPGLRQYQIDGLAYAKAEGEIPAILGTAGYTAPEAWQLSGNLSERQKMDIFALGTVLAYVRGLIALPEVGHWESYAISEVALKSKEYSLQTTMQARKVDKALQMSGTGPTELLLRQMLDPHPSERPSSIELLEQAADILTAEVGCGSRWAFVADRPDGEDDTLHHIVSGSFTDVETQRCPAINSGLPENCSSSRPCMAVVE